MIINVIPDSNNSFKPSFEPHKIPKNVRYVYGLKDFNGVTLFWDNCFDDEHIHILDEVKSKFKFAILHDPVDISKKQLQRRENIVLNLDKFDKVLTHDEVLLTMFKNHCIFAPDNGVWVSDDQIKIYNKTKLCSMIYSWKTFTEGHKLRHQIANLGIEGLDLYGDGSNHPIKRKEEALADYQFSITIENSRSKYYYTEKLLDCFACGTIPIYWGCTNVGDYFNKKGIIEFVSLSDLMSKLMMINDYEINYEKMLPYIEENFNKVQEYRIYEDMLYERIYRYYE